MRLVDWLTIAAILLGPVLAIQVNTYLEKRKDARRRREFVFKTLMATRANRVSVEHVQALNMIDIEFYGKRAKDRAVLVAWKAYHDVLGDRELGKNEEIWANKRDEVFIDLLYRMAVSLGYDFDKTSIKNTSYSPTWHGTVEDELNRIRKGLATILSGEAAFPMEIVRSEPTPEEIEQQKKEQERQMRANQIQEDYLTGKIPQKVIVIRDEAGVLSGGTTSKLLEEETGQDLPTSSSRS
jgi:hypothetical protein